MKKTTDKLIKLNKEYERVGQTYKDLSIIQEKIEQGEGYSDITINIAGNEMEASMALELIRGAYSEQSMTLLKETQSIINTSKLKKA